MLKTTQVERRLIEAAQAGQLLDVSNESERDVRAVVIRGLLCGWHTKALDPRGVRLRGAHIVDELDLTDVRASVPLVLHSCEQDEPLILTRAHLPHLDLTESAFPELVGNDFTCEHDARLRGINCGQVSLTGANIVGDCDLRYAQLMVSNGSAVRAGGLTVGGDMLLNYGVVTSSNSEYGALYFAASTIAGQLDLSGARLIAFQGPALQANGATISGGMFLNEGFIARSDSEFGTLRLLGATVSRQLNLSGAHLTAANGPALAADGLTVHGGSFLGRNFTANSDSEYATLRLAEATITGQLVLRDATLTATHGYALDVQGLTVRDLFLDHGFTASSDSKHETLRLNGSSITHQFAMRGAQLAATNGPILRADGMTVGAALLLDEGFTAKSASEEGALIFLGTTVFGELNLSGAQLTNTNGPAIEAEGLTVHGGMFLNGIFAATSNSEDGALRLLRATVSGQLNLSGAQLTNTNGPAIEAEGITVHGGMFLAHIFTATSNSEYGALRLPGATVSGQLNLSEAQLSNTNGPALSADGLTVRGAMHLKGEFTATSDSRKGTLRLLGATIADELSLSSAQLSNTNGPALSADGLTTGANLFLDEGFTANSDSEDGAIRLTGAIVAAQLVLRGAQITATNGPALVADGLTVRADLFLDEGFTAKSNSDSGTLCFSKATIAKNLTLKNSCIRNAASERVVLDICGAQVGNDFHISPQSFISNEHRAFYLDLDGVRYPFIPQGIPCQIWLKILSRHTPAYMPQPYQQLAAVYRAAGHDREARQIFIAQQRDLRRRGDIGGPGRKFLHALSGLFIGYGHRPFRALGFLAGVCLLSGGVVLTASLLGLTAHPAPSGAPCSMAESFSLIMDTAIPLLKYGGGRRCEILATTDWGQVLYVATYLLHMLGWAFATLFVAGYTGLVRKTT